MYIYTQEDLYIFIYIRKNIIYQQQTEFIHKWFVVTDKSPSIFVNPTDRNRKKIFFTNIVIILTKLKYYMNRISIVAIDSSEAVVADTH